MALSTEINTKMRRTADLWNREVTGYISKVDEIVASELEALLDKEGTSSTIDSVVRRSGFENLPALLDEIDQAYDVYGDKKYKKLYEHYRFLTKLSIRNALWNRVKYKLSEAAKSAKEKENKA